MYQKDDTGSNVNMRKSTMRSGHLLHVQQPDLKTAHLKIPKSFLIGRNHMSCLYVEIHC